MFRTLQAAEIWDAHGAWVESHDAKFGPGIRDRFLMASKIQPDAVQAAKEQQKMCASLWLCPKLVAG